MPNIGKYVSKVYLEPIKHEYIHKETGCKYKSVTKVLSLIEPHFDTEAIATAIFKQPTDRKKAVYIGMSVDAILEYWQSINDKANEYGTYVHETIEKYLLNNKIWFGNELERKICLGYDGLNIDEGKFMYPERILFSEEYELAGMSDLIIDINDDFFDVGDWKTNKEFNFYNKFGFETLLKPLEHMQNCQWSIYTLQLSLYALMYEMETGKKCRHIWVGYWDKKTETMTKIPIMYLKNDAKKILELFKYNKMTNI